MISINEAAERGISRLRLPVWANPLDHIKLDILKRSSGPWGSLGPWLHLWCPFNKECNGRDPVDIIITQFDCSIREYEPYTGPLPDSDEYKAAVAAYDGCLAQGALASAPR